jgi:hypothetical protein
LRLLKVALLVLTYDFTDNFMIKSFNFKENSDAGDVIYHSVILPPFLRCGSNYRIASLFGLVLNKKRQYDASNSFIAKELPHTITCDHDEFVTRLEA